MRERLIVASQINQRLNAIVVARIFGKWRGDQVYLILRPCLIPMNMTLPALHRIALIAALALADRAPTRGNFDIQRKRHHAFAEVRVPAAVAGEHGSFFGDDTRRAFETSCLADILPRWLEYLPAVVQREAIAAFRQGNPVFPHRVLRHAFGDFYFGIGRCRIHVPMQ